MVDLQQAADVLYGPEPKAESREPEAKPSAADVLYANTPTDVASANTYGPAQRAISEAATDRFGLDHETAQAAAAEWTGTFQKYGIGDEAGQLVNVAVGALAQGPDPAWAGAARAALVSDFGGEAGADRALAAAKALVAQDAKLCAFLHETGLGSHPRVVLALANRAHHLKRGAR